MRRILTILAFAVALAAPVIMRAQNNPVIGTWKLNLAKSKYSPGPLPKSLTTKNELAGNGIKNTAEGIAGDGSRIAYSYPVNYDGKDYPITGVGYPNGADSVAFKQIDANTIDGTMKKAGKVVQTTRTVYSKDGKLRTVNSKGTSESGQPTNNLGVFDRQ